MDALRKSDSFLGCLQIFPRGTQDPTLPSAGSIQVNKKTPLITKSFTVSFQREHRTCVATSHRLQIVKENISFRTKMGGRCGGKEKKRSGEEMERRVWGGSMEEGGLEEGWRWGEGFNASERCLIFQHHLFLVLQAGSLVCVKRLPRTPCSQTASSRNWTASVTCFKQPQDVTRSASNCAILDEAVSLQRLIRWTTRKQRKEKLQP